MVTAASSIRVIFSWRRLSFEITIVTDFSEPAPEGFENESCDFNLEVCDAVATARVGKFVVEEGDKILSHEIMVVSFLYIAGDVAIGVLCGESFRTLVDWVERDGRFAVVEGEARVVGSLSFFCSWFWFQTFLLFFIAKSIIITVSISITTVAIAATFALFHLQPRDRKSVV